MCDNGHNHYTIEACTRLYKHTAIPNKSFFPTPHYRLSYQVMSTSKFTQGQLKLNIQLSSAENYFSWSKSVKDQLRTQGILCKELNKYTTWLTTPLPAEDRNELVKWQEKQIDNELVKLLMVNNLSPTLLGTIDETKDAKTIWEKLIKACIPNRANYILILKSQLSRIKMKQSAQEYILQIEEKIKQINELQDEFVTDSDTIAYIENGLPPNYRIQTKYMWLERANQTSDTYKEVIINYHTAQCSLQAEQTNEDNPSFSEAHYSQRKRTTSSKLNLQCTN